MHSYVIFKNVQSCSILNLKFQYLIREHTVQEAEVLNEERS